MRGQQLPLLLHMTDFEHKVHQLLSDGIAEKPYLFVLECQISTDRKIKVVLDGDKGVNLQDCIDISRAIEHNIDREEIDFELEVTSAGIDRKLTLPRQYKKNIGRVLKIKTLQETFEGTVKEASDTEVILSRTERQPKKIGKGKETVEIIKTLPFSEIEEALVVITF
jgi:ribosome maturation factor RimP